MKFDTHVQGVPCICEVTAYYPEVQATMSDAPSPLEFEYTLMEMGSDEYSPLLNELLTVVDDRRLLAEYLDKRNEP